MLHATTEDEVGSPDDFAGRSRSSECAVLWASKGPQRHVLWLIAGQCQEAGTGGVVHNISERLLAGRVGGMKDFDVSLAEQREDCEEVSFELDMRWVWEKPIGVNTQEKAAHDLETLELSVETLLEGDHFTGSPTVCGPMTSRAPEQNHRWRPIES